MTNSKTCIGCGERKPLAAFYKCGKYYQSRCKPCNIAANREYAKANPDKRYATHRRWREKHRNTPRLKASQIREGMVARSKKKGLPPPEWTAREIEQAIQGECVKTGIPFEFDQSQYSKSPWTPVPDRIDSSQGYSHDNVQWVCYMYNMMKQEYPESIVDHFIRALKAPAKGDF